MEIGNDEQGESSEPGVEAGGRLKIETSDVDGPAARFGAVIVFELRIAFAARVS
jgi:hypothetical protein